MTTRSTLLNILIATIATWRQRSRARLALAQLDRHILRDVGIDPAIAAFEAAKPFWRALSPLRDLPDPGPAAGPATGPANDLAAIPPGREPQQHHAA